MQTKAFIFDAINRLTALLINNLEISASNKKNCLKEYMLICLAKYVRVLWSIFWDTRCVCPILE